MFSHTSGGGHYVFSWSWDPPQLCFLELKLLQKKLSKYIFESQRDNRKNGYLVATGAFAPAVKSKAHGGRKKKYLPERKKVHEFVQERCNVCL